MYYKLPTQVFFGWKTLLKHLHVFFTPKTLQCEHDYNLKDNRQSMQKKRTAWCWNMTLILQ